MTLERIELPESIGRLPLSAQAARLIDEANERIEALMLAGRPITENFVTCDFQLVDRTLQWIVQNHLLAGNRFCEWGSGIGVVTMLAAIHGMESVGIEIDPVLVDQSSDLADDLGIPARFFRGSWLPHDALSILGSAAEIEHVDTDEAAVYDELGLAIDDFDLLFAFPWPGEQYFFEAILDQFAADGALLLTYRGRDGMELVRRA